MMDEQANDVNYEKRIVRGMFKAFLEGRRPLNWAVSLISPSLFGDPVLELLDSLKGRYNEERFQDLISICIERGIIEPDAFKN